jgi:hypothetical protein
MERWVPQEVKMEFRVYGPFDMPRTDSGLIASAASDRKEFWAAVEEEEEGLSGACGCYIFALRPAGGGARPWYVGMTRSQAGFRGECFQPHKINAYYKAIAEYQKAIPQLYLIAKISPTRKAFVKPSANGHDDVEELEDFLIGVAYSRNSSLLNIRGTKFLKDAVIPGVLNSPRGKPADAASSLKDVLGL